MNIRLALPAIIFFAVITAHGGYAQNKTDRRTEAQLRTDIYYLASDSLEGRRTSSAGERKAGDYIIKQYKDAGIWPYQDGYRYPFHFIYGKEISPLTQIGIGNELMRLNDEAFPLPFSANKDVQGDVLPDIMESGNVWMVPLYSDEAEAENPHFDCEKTIFDRSSEAQKQGATGILFYDNFGSKWPPSFNRQSEYESLDIPVAFLSHQAYAKYIHNNDAYEQDPSGGLHVELNITVKKPERTGTNIAAYIDNKAPYTVVIGAHYDHLGRGEDGNSLYAGKEPQIHNGADDNASGTAGVLAIAAWVKKKGLHHYNYLFINFSGEELGLLGSKAFVKDEKLDSQHIAYMINMDMVGRLNDSTHALTVGGVGTSPAWSEFVNGNNKRFKIIIDSSGIGPSDHTSFYLAGIPVVFLFTGTHKDYHKPTDDADKINYGGEVQVLKYAENIVETMERKPKPVFTTTRQSAIGRVNFKVTLGIMPDYSYQDKGVRVDGVSDNRPAMKAGIKEGDIIIQLGDNKVQGMQSYMEALSKFSAGNKTTVKVIRAGKEMSMPLEFIK